MTTTLNQIRRAVDVEHLLTRLEIQFKRRGGELVARCMSGRHADSNPSWGIRADDGDRSGLFYCFSCHWGGSVYDLVMTVRGCEFQEALEFVKGSSKKSVYIEDEDVVYNMTFRQYEPPGIREPIGLQPIQAGSPCVRYMSDRGFGAEEIRTFGLMDWVWRGRLWVPVRRQGLLIAWDARSYSDSDPKVLTPKGNTAGSEWGLFGLDQADRSKRVVNLVEGWADALRVWQTGLPNPVAIRGSKITEQQVSELSWADTIFVWREGDVAGSVMATEARAWFTGKRVEIVRLPKGMDPAEFRPAELVTLFQTGGGSWQVNSDGK